MIRILQIDANTTFAVRQPVLRAGKPIESCHFEGDQLKSTVHFGLYKTNELIGVISLFTTQNSNFNTEAQFQIRGMAVLEHYQRNGFGEQLIKKAEEFVIENKGTLLWFNAREKATGFYQKLDYKIKGESFNIEGIGIHYLMYKWL